MSKANFILKNHLYLNIFQNKEYEITLQCSIENPQVFFLKKPLPFNLQSFEGYISGFRMIQ